MKICVISDTHTFHSKLKPIGIDTIIHCGDFSNGKASNTFPFLRWFADLPIKNKILIAGNHDIYFEQVGKESLKKDLKTLYDINYLEDEEIIIDDIKFYGTPYVPEFYNWSFMKDEDELVKVYDNIPKDTDILITHGPEYGILDRTYQGDLVGSLSLKEKIQTLDNLKYHLTGHIHEGYGIHKGSKYTTINASSFDYYKKELNEPIVFEFYK